MPRVKWRTPMDTPTNWRDLVGKRVLVRERRDRSDSEYRIVEIAPSGLRIKLQSVVTPMARWVDTDRLMLTEVLEDTKR